MIKITEKLSLYIFFLGLVIILCVGLYLFSQAKKALINRTFEQLTSIRVAKKNQVENFFNDRCAEIKLFAQTQLIQDVFKRINNNDTADFLHNYLKQNDYLLQKKDYTSLTFISKQKEVYSINDVYERKYLSNREQDIFIKIFNQVVKRQKLYIEDYVKIDTLIQLFIASPVYSADKDLNGVVCFTLNINAINEIMLNMEKNNGLGESGEIYLVGDDFLMRSESRFIKNSILNIKVQTKASESASDANEGISILNDYRGLEVFSSYSKVNIDCLKWLIIAEMDTKEAMIPVQNLEKDLLIISILIGVFLLVVAYYISQSFTIPIKKLKNATIAVGKGDFDIKVEKKSDDEIGELTSNFNNMTQQLKQQNEELNKREQKILTAFFDGQENERTRLSRELHDGIGQMLVGMKFKFQSIFNLFPDKNEKTTTEINLCLDNIIDEIRSISKNLMPYSLKEFGLEVATNNLCNELAEIFKINITFDFFVEEKIDERKSVYLFRIIQEALNNAIKHSKADKILINLITNSKNINLTIEDNGIGINMEELNNKSGSGLHNIFQRVKLLNGIVDISNAEPCGTIISIKIQ